MIKECVIFKWKCVHCTSKINFVNLAITGVNILIIKECVIFK